MIIILVIDHHDYDDQHGKYLGGNSAITTIMDAITPASDKMTRIKNHHCHLSLMKIDQHIHTFSSKWKFYIYFTAISVIKHRPRGMHWYVLAKWSSSSSSLSSYSTASSSSSFNYLAQAEKNALVCDVRVMGCWRDLRGRRDSWDACEKDHLS